MSCTDVYVASSAALKISVQRKASNGTEQSKSQQRDSSNVNAMLKIKDKGGVFHSKSEATRHQRTKDKQIYHTNITTCIHRRLRTNPGLNTKGVSPPKK